MKRFNLPEADRTKGMGIDDENKKISFRVNVLTISCD